MSVREKISRVWFHHDDSWGAQTSVYGAEDNMKGCAGKEEKLCSFFVFCQWSGGRKFKEYDVLGEGVSKWQSMGYHWSYIAEPAQLNCLSPTYHLYADPVVTELQSSIPGEVSTIVLKMLSSLHTPQPKYLSIY